MNRKGFWFCVWLVAVLVGCTFMFAQPPTTPCPVPYSIEMLGKQLEARAKAPLLARPDGKVMLQGRWFLQFDKKIMTDRDDASCFTVTEFHGTVKCWFVRTSGQQVVVGDGWTASQLMEDD